MYRLGARNAIAWASGGVAGAVLLAQFFGAQFPWLWTVAGGLIALGVGRWVFDGVSRFRRSHALREFAAAHGWSFKAHTRGYVRRFTGYPFGMGHREQAVDLLSGTFGGLACATYVHRADFTKDERRLQRVTQEFQVTLAETDVRLPRLDLLPESFATRAIDAIGGTDINLESARFNREWRVVCADRRYAIDVLDPRMMERLLQPDALGLAIRIDAGVVMVWDTGPVGTEGLARRLAVVTGVANRIPAHVVRRYAEEEQRRRAEQAKREANAPLWAREGGILNSGRYTGIGGDGDGTGGWDQRKR